MSMPNVSLDRRRLLLAAAGSSLLPLHLAAKEDAAAGLDAERIDRLSFGATPALVDEVRRAGFEGWWLAQLKAPAPVLPAAVKARIDAMEISRVPMDERVRAADALQKAIAAASGDEGKTAARQAYRDALARYRRESASRSLLLALHGSNQVQEQLTWFWMNHFSIGAAKRDIDAMIADFEDGLRARALGRFRELLDASVFHPAMLRYLDNERNAAGRINENYARELLELHTLGVDGGYGQPDVQELARILTGLGIAAGDGPRIAGRRRMIEEAAVWRQGMVVFNPARHEAGSRTLLGQKVEGKGIDAIREVLDRLAMHPSTARHVCRKLVQHFVADDPPPLLVDAMKARFLASGGDIAAVLQTMVASKEFSASLGRKFKDPHRYVVSAVRIAYGGSERIVNPQPMLGWLQRLGQPPYGRQTPDGWPMVESAWSSSGQMNARFEVARLVAAAPKALFREGDGERDDGGPPLPAQVDNAAWQAVYAPRLSKASREVLTEARKDTPADWNALALSSPEFMRR